MSHRNVARSWCPFTSSVHEIRDGLCSCWPVSPATLNAQTTSATVVGTLTDSSGATDRRRHGDAEGSSHRH